MKMKTAKIGVLFLVALMGLTGVSAGYALWFDDLTINGTVNTGTFNVDWSVGTPYAENDAKEISSISAIIDPATPKIMTITITNAYPCVDYFIPIDLHSTGTVPAHFTEFDIDTCADWPTNEPGGSLTPNVIEIQDANHNVAVMTGDTPVQLHEGGTWNGFIHIHFDNNAQEGHTYTFEIQIRAHQYNEPYNGVDNQQPWNP